MAFPGINTEKTRIIKAPKSAAKLPFIKLNLAIINHINMALELTGGKVAGKDGAAAILDVNPGTLRNRMRKLNIPFGRKQN